MNQYQSVSSGNIADHQDYISHLKTHLHLKEIAI